MAPPKEATGGDPVRVASDKYIIGSEQTGKCKYCACVIILTPEGEWRHLVSDQKRAYERMETVEACPIYEIPRAAPASNTADESDKE